MMTMVELFLYDIVMTILCVYPPFVGGRLVCYIPVSMVTARHFNETIVFPSQRTGSHGVSSLGEAVHQLV